MLQTRAFVLKKEALGEFDRRYDLYTERFGKISAIAKSTQKITAKLPGHLEPPHLVWVGIVEGKKNGAEHRQNWQITQALELDDFYEIRKDAPSLREILRVGLIFDELFKEPERDQKIWNLWEEFLREVMISVRSSRRDSLQISSRLYGASPVPFLAMQLILRILTELGFVPDSGHCGECGKPLRMQGFFSDGEFFCAACSPDVSKKAKMPPEVFTVLDAIKSGKWLQASTVEAEIGEIVYAYLNRARELMI